MKKIGVIISAFILFAISMSMMQMNSDKISAASNYTTGKKVFIGNDSYTIIDPNAMTLLKDTATSVGDVTWDDAFNSLINLPNNY